MFFDVSGDEIDDTCGSAISQRSLGLDKHPRLESRQPY